MNDAARQDDSTEGGVGAAIEDGVDVHRRQAAVARHARAMANDRRVTLGRRQHVFDAVVHKLHGPAGLPRGERRVARDHRRILLLAAEAAAGFRLHDANPIAGQPEQDRQRAVNVVRTLHRAVDGDAAAGIRHCDDAVRLDVQLFLEAGPIFALDDHVGGLEPLVEVPLLDGDLLESRGGGFRIVMRRRRAVVDAHVGCQQSLAILMDQNQHRLGRMSHEALGQTRLVLVNQRDDVSARHVPGVDDGETGAIEVELHVDDLARRNRRPDRPRVEQALERG